MNIKLLKRLAIMASLFTLCSSPLNVLAENNEQNIQQNQPPNQTTNQTNDIIGDNPVANEENADYVTPSSEELEAIGEMEVIENVDENGQPFNPTADLNGKKQFLSFRTADNETYYLVVSYAHNTSKVHLLKDVNHEDIQELNNIQEEGQAPEAGEADKENADKLSSDKEVTLKDPDEDTDSEGSNEEEKENSNSKLLIIVAVFLIVLVIGFVRMKKNKSDDYE